MPAIFSPSIDRSFGISELLINRVFTIDQGTRMHAKLGCTVVLLPNEFNYLYFMFQKKNEFNYQFGLLVQN
jgi:hypothetical protein